jgi:hypothetical protein
MKWLLLTVLACSVAMAKEKKGYSDTPICVRAIPDVPWTDAGHDLANPIIQEFQKSGFKIGYCDDEHRA